MYDAHIKTNSGNKRELALARRVANEVLEHFRPDGADVFLGDHNHECLSRGSCSVSWEGGPYDWPLLWQDSDRGREVAEKFGVQFEAVNNCILAVYRVAA